MLFPERVFCGQLTPDDAGRKVLLAGWVDAFRDHGAPSLTLEEGIVIGVFPADCPYVADLVDYKPPREDWTQEDLDLYAEAEAAKRGRAFRELTETLTDEDLESMGESSREFREKLKI